MAESDNRHINGVDNGWLGDCIIVSAMKCNHKITQHFFFFTKRKPVLKEKQICSFGKAFLSKKRFIVKSRGFYFNYTNSFFILFAYKCAIRVGSGSLCLRMQFFISRSELCSDILCPGATIMGLQPFLLLR